VEHTLALIKPDGVARKLVGKILHIIEEHEVGPSEYFKIIRLQMMDMSIERAKWFYGRQHEGKPYFNELCEFMSSGPIVVVILKANKAIDHWRYLMGPSSYTARMQFQIRTRFQRSSDRLMENLVHGSDSRESFSHEVLALGFNPMDYPDDVDL